jgi:putative ABC transport system ATP-binding protein
VETSGRDALVSLDSVRKAYPGPAGESPVLDDLSMRVEPGELLVILGPSGCGKTTLLNLVGGLDAADAGTIHSCGVNLSEASAAELTRYRARSVGFVFQFYNLLPTLTVLENVVAGVTVAGIGRREAQQQALEVLQRVGLSGREARFPSELSGGEQQRVALARALAKSPPLLLADEPTGNLDEDTAAGVRDTLAQLNRDTGVTMIIVTHNPTLAAAAQRAVRLDHGRIVGTPAGYTAPAPSVTSMGHHRAQP